MVEQNIKRLIVDYHKCINKPFVSFNNSKRKKRNFEIGLLYRGYFTKLKDAKTEREYSISSSVSPYVIFYFPKSKNRWALEFRYAYITAEDEFGNKESVHEFPIRVNRYFKVNNHRLSTKFGADIYRGGILSAGFILGIGYDYSIKKIRLVSNIDLYLLGLKRASYTLGMGYQF